MTAAPSTGPGAGRSSTSTGSRQAKTRSSCGSTSGPMAAAARTAGTSTTCRSCSAADGFVVRNSGSPESRGARKGAPFFRSRQRLSGWRRSDSPPRVNGTASRRTRSARSCGRSPDTVRAPRVGCSSPRTRPHAGRFAATCAASIRAAGRPLASTAITAIASPSQTQVSPLGHLESELTPSNAISSAAASTASVVSGLDLHAFPRGRRRTSHRHGRQPGG